MEERSDKDATNGSGMDDSDFNLLDVVQARIRSHNVESQSQQEQQETTSEEDNYNDAKPEPKADDVSKVLQDKEVSTNWCQKNKVPKAALPGAQPAYQDESSKNDHDLDLLQVVEARIRASYREQSIANQVKRQLYSKAADNYGVKKDKDLSTKKKDLPIKKVQEKKIRKQQVPNLGQVVMTPELEKSINEGTYTASSFWQRPGAHIHPREAPPATGIVEGGITIGSSAVPDDSLPGAYARAGAPSTNSEIVEEYLLEPRGVDVEDNPDPEGNWNASVQMPLASGEDLAVANPVDEDGRSLQRDLPLATPDAETQTRKESNLFQGCLVGFVVVGIVLVLVFLLIDGSDSDEGGVVSQETQTILTSSPTLAPTSLMDAKHAFLQDLLPSYTLDALLKDKGLWADEQNASLPQALAYEWMMEDPDLLEYEDWRVQQRFALATFFHATGGPDWYVNNGWLTNYSLHECLWYMKSFSGFVEGEDRPFYHDPIVMYEQARTNPCHQTVEGVVADNTSTSTSTTNNSSHGIGDGIYKHLWMPENNLHGSIPLEVYELLPALRSISLFLSSFAETVLSSHIGLLTNLEALNLAHTDLQGTLPPSLSQAALTNLILFSNKITGTIPTELALLTDLQTLLLDLNDDLTGSIPTQFGNLKKLSAFNIDQTRMTGPIPSQMGQMTSLNELYVEWSQLSGPLPTELGLLTQMQRFWLTETSISGALPTEIGLLTNMEKLYLDNALLSGTIISELGLLTRMRKLYFYRCQFTGTIPTQLGLISLLEKVFLHGQGLTGTIPSELGLLNLTQSLRLYENQLSGVIPSELGLLTAASKLYLYHNSLTGTFPTELFQMPGLYELVVEGNFMDSTLPSQLALLPAIEKLYFGSNFFTGTIPSEVGQLETLDTLMLNGNNLTGTLPQEVALLPYLRQLNLTDTSISGTLPESVCELKYLGFDCSSMLLCGCDCGCITTDAGSSNTSAGISMHFGNDTHTFTLIDGLVDSNVSFEVLVNDTD